RAPGNYELVGDLEINDSGAGQIGIVPPPESSHRILVLVTLEENSEADAPQGPEVLSGRF
ncbi:MAG: hypothetical protein ACOC9Y_08555, partial [Chloroflexota bacterium]